MSVDALTAYDPSTYGPSRPGPVANAPVDGGQTNGANGSGALTNTSSPALAADRIESTEPTPITLADAGHDGSAAQTATTATTNANGDVTPARRKAIDDWLASNASPGAIGSFFGGSGSSRVAQAVNGDSSLGKLDPAEQKYAVGGALSRWEKSGDTSSILSLGDALHGNDGASSVFAKHAADVVQQGIESGAGHDAELAGSLATAAANSSSTPQALGNTIRGLGSQGAYDFGDALAGGEVKGSFALSTPLGKALDGVNGGANDAVAHAFTLGAMTGAQDDDFHNALGLTTDAAGGLGRAIARMNHPDDRKAQDANASDLAGRIAASSHPSDALNRTANDFLNAATVAAGLPLPGGRFVKPNPSEDASARLNADPQYRDMPGAWKFRASERMSERAAAYQERATGQKLGNVYEVEGKGFDGVQRGADGKPEFIDAKGPGYEQITDPSRPWSRDALNGEIFGSKGTGGLARDAEIAAQNGGRLVVRVAEQGYADRLRQALAQAGVRGVRVEYFP